MSDGDDLVIGESNIGTHTTELSLYLDTKANTVFKVTDVTDATCIVGKSVDGETTGGHGTGVRGESVFGFGVHGKSSSEAGVVGESDTSDGVRGSSTTVGVQGDSDTGTGVSGSSDKGTGVKGSSDSGVGVRGTSTSDYGVKGKSKKTAGVYGESTKATGVLGYTGGADAVAVNGYAQSGTGVRGDSWSGPGVYGTSASKEGVSGFSSLGTAVYGQVPSSVSSAYAGRFDGQVLVNGAFTVVGAKSAAVRLPDGSHRLMYCQESPEPWFEDFGEAKLARGRAKVRIDRDFVKTLDVTKPYHVFVTAHSVKIGALAVTERRPDHFVVEAENSAAGSFSYRIVGRRKDASGVRLAKVKIPARLTTPRFLTEHDVPAKDE